MNKATNGASAALDALVDRIDEAPGDLIDPRSFIELQEGIDVKDVVATLPEGLDETDLIGILKLALLTECAAETFAGAIEERAQRFNAPWLSRFNQEIWLPDELTHHTPYKLILMSLGFSEAELDREIKDTQAIPFEHRGGDLPVQVTTFGTLQEYLTDNWHGLVGKLLKPAAPRAAYMSTRIKRRETLHTMWYRDMTALQLEADPGLLPEVAEALLKFEMPSNQVAPELQSEAPRWLPLMGADFERITKDLIRLLHEATGSVRRTGELLMELASARGYKLGPVSTRHIQFALNRLGGPGYGLVGEAVLEKVGLSYLFKRPAGAQDSGFAAYDGVYERIRGLLRGWLASQMELRLGARV